MKNKLASRKFWICVAAFLASIATSISGYSCNNEVITVIGLICATFSAAIYTAMEAVVDMSSNDSNMTITEIKKEIDEETIYNNAINDVIETVKEGVK